MNEKETSKEENNSEKIINNNTEEKYLLPPKSENKIYLKTLILDLDETLAHGQNIPFASTKNQISLQCKINNVDTTIYVKIRPGVKEFLRKMNKIYEIIIFTASIEEYAKPLINLIDQKNICSYKLYREHCTLDKTTYIKDLKKLGRDLKDVIIIDNSPNSYSLNKENGIPITTWFDDEDDRELYNIVQILEFLSDVDDVRVFIPKFVIGDEISYLASSDIIKKFKNKNGKNSNLSAINFHPFMNALNTSNITNNEEKNISKFNKEMDKKEKDLIEISENIFDDVMLNENINRTEFDIRINDESNLLTTEGQGVDSKEEIKNENENEKKDDEINKDIKNDITKEKENNKDKEVNLNANNDDKKFNANTSKNNESKINKNKNRSKIKQQQKNNGVRKIIHVKSSSYNINTISNFNFLMPNHKQKKENLSKNKIKPYLTIKHIKSKTVKKPNKLTLDEKNKKNIYRPRNIITEFKPLKTINNSVNINPDYKRKSKLNTISKTPKKTKKADKNKIQSRILSQISKSKEKKEKIKPKEESKIEEINKKQNNISSNINNEINKKELIKHRKKTPFRVKPKKEKNSNNNIINISIRKEPEKEKENKIINYRNKIVENSLEKNKKENITTLKEKTIERKMNKTINNNHKAAKSTKNFHVNENRKPWGWGGYTLKLSDIDNLFNYNVESREIRIAKIDINIYKRAKSHKLVKKDKKNDNTKKKGILSANSTNITINKTENNKD